MPKELTKSAQAAKIIRTNLKKQGLVCNVSSRNFSMGDSVDITIYDQQNMVLPG